MTVRRSPPRITDQLPRDDDLRLDGFHTGWLAFDRRSFTDILQQWHDKTAPHDPARFLRNELRLQGALSRSDLHRLLTGQAAPSRKLALWIAAVVPHDIATTRVLRNRALSARLHASSSTIVDISDSALAMARTTRLTEIANSHLRAGSTEEGSGFFKELLDRLQQQIGRDDLDPEATANNLAKALNIPAEVLHGRAPLPGGQAETAANELAAMLQLEGGDFDDFAAGAASQFMRSRAASKHDPLTRLATAARFLRTQAGLSQKELTNKMGGTHRQREAVTAIEQGYPSLDASALVAALELDDGTAHILSQLVAEAERELTNPSQGRPLSPLEQAAKHFAKDGLNTSAYLKAARQQPQLFSSSPATIVGNITGVVERFAAHGLTTPKYLKAALTFPSLFYQSPDNIANNVAGVVERFTKDGLTTGDYLKAVLQQPSLFFMSPATVAANITGVVERFAADGLKTGDYLKAALKRPRLFSQSPTTITSNITGVAEHFATDGLTRGEYLKAALKQPQLFSHAPGTVIGHVNMLINLHRQGLVTFPAQPDQNQSLRPVFEFLVKNPVFFSLASDNFTLREISARGTGEQTRGTTLLRRPRHQVESDLAGSLGHSDQKAPVPKVPQPAEKGSDRGPHARNLLLRALIREGIVKGTLER